jgi:hypothetical protein
MFEDIFNKLEILGNENQVREVRAFLGGEPNEEGNNNYIDFNKIIQSPDGKETIEWNCKNWGTEYNAYYQESPEPNIIQFVTANNPVPELMTELSSEFPDVPFIYHFDLPDVIMDPEVSLFIKNGVGIEIPQKCFEIDSATEEDVINCKLSNN